MEEEVAEARASATIAWVRASGVFSTIANSCRRVLSLDFNGILLVIVLEGQLVASRHEVEDAHHR
jgi:hypothetical protein